MQEVASLPTELADDDEEAKRFDLLMLNLQLAVLHVEPGFERLKGAGAVHRRDAGRQEQHSDGAGADAAD